MSGGAANWRLGTILLGAGCACVVWGLATHAPSRAQSPKAQGDSAKAPAAKAVPKPPAKAPAKAAPVKPPPTPINPNEKYPFRTEQYNGHLPWYQPVPGEFPPEGAARYFGGELIQVDHINREGILRQDRTDAQNRAMMDRPLPFAMLPYGSIQYRGAPASLKDIPLGTHLHGEFLWNSERDADPALKAQVAARRLSTDYQFNHCLRLEDDFSRSVRTGRYWRIDEPQWGSGKLVATRVGPKGESPDPAPTTFLINSATRVWQGRSIATLQDLAAGQIVALNLTVCTLKGPGRCTDIWIDADSRELARRQQLEVHRHYIREHGLPGWIDAVDNEQSLVTVTLFDGYDPTLTRAMLIPYGTLAVAEDSLRTYDQVNDVKSGLVRGWKSVPVRPGSSGTQVTVQPGEMLEGFRPQRIVRLFLATWGVEDLPLEEKLFQ